MQAGACAISFFSIRCHLVSHQFVYLSGGFHHTFLIKGTGCGFRILSTSFSLFMNLAEGLKSFSTRIHLLYSCFAAGFSPSRFSFGRFTNYQMLKAFSRWYRLPPAPFWLPNAWCIFPLPRIAPALHSQKELGCYPNDCQSIVIGTLYPPNVPWSNPIK